MTLVNTLQRMACVLFALLIVRFVQTRSLAMSVTLEFRLTQVELNVARTRTVPTVERTLLSAGNALWVTSFHPSESAKNAYKTAFHVSSQDDVSCVSTDSLCHPSRHNAVLNINSVKNVPEPFQHISLLIQITFFSSYQSTHCLSP